MDVAVTLADGTVIGMDGRPVESGSSSHAETVAADVAPSTVVPSVDDSHVREVAAAPGRRLADLPDPPRVLNALGAIISYELYGIADNEIASATGISTARLAELRHDDSYASMRATIIRNVLASEQGEVRDLFTKNARRAASALVGNLTAKKATVRNAAANSILDRAGLRPVDVVEHRHTLDGGLTIEVIKRDEKRKPLTIDMEF